MLLADNFHAKILCTYTHFFSYVFKNYIDFLLSKCENEKKFKYVCICFSKVDLVSCYQIVQMTNKKENTFEMRNTQ